MGTLVRTMRGVVVCLGVMAIANGAQAAQEEWLLVIGGSNYHSATFVEKTTFRRDGGTVTLWVDKRFDEEGAPKNNPEVRSIKEHFKYFCESNKVQLLTAAFFDINRKVILREDAFSTDPAMDIAPGSLDWGLKEVVCNPNFGKTKMPGVFPVGDEIGRATQLYFESSIQLRSKNQQSPESAR